MEEKLKIFGGQKLEGRVKVDASKNSFLPILAATALCDGQVCLKNYVALSDLLVMREILHTLGIESSLNGKEIIFDTRNIKNLTITCELSRELRASVIFLGALLGRFRKAVIAYPGGCKIGARPIDIHLKGFRALGAKIIERHGYIYCNGENLHSGEVVFSFPSVGATESLMLCACLLKGETVLKNVAKEPDIVDLQNFL